MPPADRRVSISIDGPIAAEGRVPIGLLSEKLTAAQRALFNIGSALLGGGRRGTWKTEVLQGCQLLFVEARRGSLEIVAETPPSLTLLPELEVGERAVDRLAATLEALTAKDPGPLHMMYPDFGQRARIVKSFIPLLPEEGADYDVLITARLATFRLDTSIRPFLSRLTLEDSHEPTTADVRTLTGRLFRIEVETGERQIGLKVSHRQIRCFYPEDLEDVMRDLVPGSLVEVDGLVTLDVHGDVLQVEEVLDARTVQLVPLYWQRIVYGGRYFRLRQPLQIRSDFANNLWIYEHEPLGILAFASTRAEALQATRMEFVAAWDSIAMERDERLTADAQALKQRLMELVESVDDTSAHQ
jgi:hypothetical protein